MTSTTHKPDVIEQVPPERLAEAVSRVMLGGQRPDEAQAEMFIAFAQARRIPLDMCYGKMEGATYWPVCLVIPNPGRTALYFTSAPATEVDVAQVSDVIAFAHHGMDRNRVALAQALLAREETLLRRAFEHAGFQRLAELAYLEKRVSAAAQIPAVTWPHGVRVHAYSPERHRDFRQALEESYAETMDCPGLCGLRDLDDVITGHRGHGHFDESLWTIAYLDERPAAVLFLNALPEHETLELSYIGIGRTVRGRGLGRALVRHAVYECAARRLKKITLAVDLDNEPALRLYRSEGFYQVDSRIALVQPARS